MIKTIERAGIELKFFDLCNQVLDELGLRLYNLDYMSGQQLLRVFIIDPKTKTALIDDCTRVDRAMSPFIEESDWMPEELTLEVSSPGLYRELRDYGQLAEALGERVNLLLHNKVQKEELIENKGLKEKQIVGQKKLVGHLEELDDNNLILNIEKSARLKVGIENIKKANVEPAWEDIKES